MNITLSDISLLLRLILDILVVWALIYYALRIVRNNTRTIQITKGILFIIIVQGLSTLLGLNALSFLISIFVNWGVVVIVIIFQPEIRMLLEKLGKTSVLTRLISLSNNEREHLVNELVKACEQMSSTKTGALISLEQGQNLSDYIKTGTSMNSQVSCELLCSIFQYGTPLHDGAVIIQGVKIACAAAYFPPTTKELPTSYGARHRAAVGISEITDSITIIVSEETGNISIAESGDLKVYSVAQLRAYLMERYQVESLDEEEPQSVFEPVAAKEEDEENESGDDLIPTEAVVVKYRRNRTGRKRRRKGSDRS